jgi:hypothetical protein
MVSSTAVEPMMFDPSFKGFNLEGNLSFLGGAPHTHVGFKAGMIAYMSVSYGRYPNANAYIRLVYKFT